MWPGDVNDVMGKGFLRFGKSQRVKFLPRKKTVDYRSSPRPCVGCRTWFRAGGKVSIERLCLSLPYVEKPFNSKVIKSFVPELRSRVFVFRDPYVIYKCVMDIMNVLRSSMNMSISHIHVWLCNTTLLSE